MNKDFTTLVTAKLAALRDGNVYSVSKHNALTKSLKGRMSNLDVDLHASAVAALHIAIENGDTSGMASVANLLNSLGKAIRARTLAGWVERYSDIVLTFHKKENNWTAKLCPKDQRRSIDALTDLAVKALRDPFWNKPEKGERDFSLHGALSSLLKRADKAENLSADDKAVIAEMRVLVAKLEPVE